MVKKVIAFSVLLFLLIPGLTLAKTNPKDKKITVLPRDEIIDSDYFAIGDIVEISGTVNGDVYAAGGTVLVDGVINGDLMAAAGTITVSGTVSQDVRAAGGAITILNKIGRNATLLSGNIDLTENASIAGNLTAAAGNININSQVGSIEAAAGNLRLASNANVQGDINYISEEQISVSETASISGTINRRQTPELAIAPNAKKAENFVKGLSFFSLVSSALASLILGLLLIRFFPYYVKNAANILAARPLPSFGIGLAGLIITPIILIILIVTLLGIPLAMLLIPLFIFYLYLSRLYAIVAIGSKIASATNKKPSLTTVFIAGLAAYYFLLLIPFIGGLTKLLVTLMGLGAAILNDKNTWQASRKAKIV